MAAAGGEGVLRFSAGQSKGADGDGLREIVLEPGVGAVFIEGQFRAVGNVSVTQLLHGENAAAGGDGGTQFGKGLFFLRHFDRHHGNVLIPWCKLLKDRLIHAGIGIQILADGLIRLRQAEGLAAAVSFHLHRSPGEFLHGIGGLHPGTAGAAPAGSGGDAHFHAQGIGQLDGIGKTLLPAIT